MKRSTDNTIILLHRKKFLQPFEKILAIEELRGLRMKYTPSEKTDMFSVKLEDKQKNKLLARLAYFDWAASEVFEPVLQSCREGTNPNTPGPDYSFPNRRVLRFGPHNFHEYRGKFFPQLVRSICNIAGLSAGSKVLDPMCGSGTTLVESRALDLISYGLDKNPLSVLITEVKTGSIGWKKSQIARIRSDIQKAMSDNQKFLQPWEQIDYEYLKRWFSVVALNEIATLLNKINAIEDEQTRKFAQICLSDTIRTVSYQKAEDLRVRKKIFNYVKGDATKLFKEKVSENLDAVDRLSAVDSDHNTRFYVKNGDAREPQNCFKEEVGEIDAIITSPPYATALPYLDTDRLSLVTLRLLSRSEHKVVESEMIGTREITEKQRMKDWDLFQEHRDELPNSVTKEIDDLSLKYHNNNVGFRRRNLPTLLAKYFLNMNCVLQGMKTMLKDGAPAYVVIGNNSTIVNGMHHVIPTDELLEDMAKFIGFKISTKVDMELLASRDIFKKNRGSKEKILHLVNTI